MRPGPYPPLFRFTFLVQPVMTRGEKIMLNAKVESNSPVPVPVSAPLSDSFLLVRKD